MSFWAGIQGAINSTLGTDKFQPLDKLIKGGTKILASYDYVLTPISYNSVSGTSEEVSFSCDGTAYFSAIVNLTPPTNITTASATITVQKKNESEQWENVGQKSTSYSGSTATRSERVYALADIIPNEVYRFRVSYNNASVDASSGAIYGLPISAYLEITKS